jgi:hypothetical protein
MSKLKRRAMLVGGAAGVLVAAGATGAFATARLIGAGGVIQACYRTSDDDCKGERRAVTDSSACRSNELPISWNIQGPKGDRGDKGETGAQGPVGASGPQGPSGTSALRGQSCTEGRVVIGFDNDGNVLCGFGGSSQVGGGSATDTDLDGVPDASDPCPLFTAPVIEFDGTSYCPSTPYLIARSAMTPGTRVLLRDVAVLEVLDGATITVGVLEGDPGWEGPDGSSLRVFASTGGLSLTVGTRVFVYGTVTSDGALTVDAVVTA